jgi:hypothetical protein
MWFVSSSVSFVVVVCLTGCYLKPAPRWYMRSNNGSSFFDIALSNVPPPGSVIRVTGSAQASLCT